MLVGIKMVETASVETGRSTNDAMYFVASFEQ